MFQCFSLPVSVFRARILYELADNSRRRIAVHLDYCFLSYFGRQDSTVGVWFDSIDGPTSSSRSAPLTCSDLIVAQLDIGLYRHFC